MDQQWTQTILALLAQDDLIMALGMERFQAFVQYCRDKTDTAVIRLTSPTEPVYFLWVFVSIDRDDPEADLVLRVREVQVPDPDDESTWLELPPEGVTEGHYFMA